MPCRNIFFLIGILAFLAAGCDQIKEDSSGKFSSERKVFDATAQKNDEIKLDSFIICEYPSPLPDTFEIKSGKRVYLFVEKPPEFPGGIKVMNNFIAKNLKYPAAALETNITGSVFTSFIVEKNGAISDVTILKGIGYGCDEEAIRVVSSFPKWKPGMNSGKAVHVRYNLPIRFQLPNSNLRKQIHAVNSKHIKGGIQPIQS